MNEKSVEVPALKDLLNRPWDLGTVELMERAMRDARVVGGYWTLPWGNAWRSLKRYGSSPEHMMDLLLLLEESSDEKMQLMDLDDITVEHLTAGRSALREAIGKVELAVKKGEKWNCRRGTWLWWFTMGRAYLGSEALPILQALDVRASILMTRMEQEAEKENDTTCLQEVA